MATNDLVVRYETIVQTIDHMDEYQYDEETIHLPLEPNKDLYKVIQDYFDNSEANLIEVRSIKIVEKDH